MEDYSVGSSKFFSRLGDCIVYSIGFLKNKMFIIKSVN